MRCCKAVLLAVVASVVVVPSVLAQGLLLTEYKQIGGYYAASATAPFGYLWLADPPLQAKACGAGYGVAFPGPTTVTSMVIEQSSDAGRMVIQCFDLYADGVHSGYVYLDTQTKDPQTARIVGLDRTTPLTVTATWIVLQGTVAGLYPPNATYTGTDKNAGVKSLAFYGTPCVPADREENLNLNMKRVVANGSFAVGGSSALATTVVDGTLSGAIGQSLLWSRKTAGTQSLTVYYDDDGKNPVPQTIGSIGISFAADYQDRSIPKWVMITGSLPGQELKVWIDETMTQYDRYAFGRDAQDVERAFSRTPRR